MSRRTRSEFENDDAADVQPPLPGDVMGEIAASAPCRELARVAAASRGSRALTEPYFMACRVAQLARHEAAAMFLTGAMLSSARRRRQNWFDVPSFYVVVKDPLKGYISLTFSDVGVHARDN